MTLTDQPNHGRVTPARTVLVSGASIAGPTVAYWLNRYGYEVTVVERASRRAAAATPSTSAAPPWASSSAWACCPGCGRRTSRWSG